MSKRVFLLGVGLVLVAWAFVLTDRMLTPRAGITPANLGRIREGMTPQQVEGILGEAGSCQLFQQTSRGGAPVPREQRYTVLAGGRSMFWHWWTDRQPKRQRITIVFDEHGLVWDVAANFEPEPPQPSLLARLRDWLGW